MTLDQIIGVHDEMVTDLENEFPKPLAKETLNLIQPKLTLVPKPKVKPEYTAEMFLEERLQDFFNHLMDTSDF